MSAEQENAQWAEPWSGPPPLSAFKAQREKEVDEINRRCGGPAPYLQRLGQPELDDFAKYLWEEFPEKDDVVYHHDDPIPSVKEDDLGSEVPVTVHVASLGFSPDCSLKPAPGADLFSQLSAQILQDGFVTAGDPLLVVQSRGPANSTKVAQLWSGDTGQPLGTFSVGYLKGMARATTALALLH